jgi:hypothetical protein
MEVAMPVWLQCTALGIGFAWLVVHSWLHSEAGSWLARSDDRDGKRGDQIDRLELRLLRVEEHLRKGADL